MIKQLFIIKLLLIALFFSGISDLYAGTTDITIDGSTGITYDDNITYAETDKKADFISTLSTGLGLKYENRRTFANFHILLNQDLYWKYTNNNNLSEHVSMDLRHDLTKFDHLSVSDRFTHADEPTSFEEEFSRSGGRYSYFRNRFDINYVRDFTEELSLQVGYGNDIDDATTDDVMDSQANRFSIQGVFAFNSRMSTYGFYNYTNRELDPGGEARINTLGVGVTQTLSEQLSLDIYTGADIIDSYNGDQLTKPLWGAKLKHQINDRSAANLSYSQRYSTNPYTADVFKSWTISGGIDSQLLQRLYSDLTIFYGRGEYSMLKIDDDLFGGSAGLTYEINKNVKSNILYTYSQTSSNIDSREYKKNTVYLGITAGF